MKVDLPAPGAPEMPTRIALPVCGSSAASTASARAWWSRRVDSTSVMAFASARGWRASTPSTSCWSAAASNSWPAAVTFMARCIDAYAGRWAAACALRIAASTCFAQAGIGVPGPKMPAAPALCRKS